MSSTSLKDADRSPPVASGPDRRPRLLLAVTHPMTAQYLMRGQLSHFVSGGFEVTLVTGRSLDLAKIPSTEGIEWRTVSLRREISPLLDLHALFQLARLFRSKRPEIVCSSTPKAGLLGMVAATFAKVPNRVYLVRGLRLETVRGWKRTVLRLTERAAAACAHRVVFVSPSLQRAFLDRGLCPAGKTSIVAHGSSHGVDTRHFFPAKPGSPRPLLETPGSNSDESSSTPVIGFVGRIVSNKGIGDLIDAITHVVLPQFPATRLTIVGDFEPGDAVSSQHRQFLQDHPAVTITGFVDDTAPWYRQMDVLALPSYREGFPNVVLEAAATSLPVVGYAATGTVDAVVDESTGILVPAGDWRALGRALCRYLGDSALARKHGAAARERATTLYSQDTVWNAWNKYFHDLLDPELA